LALIEKKKKLGLSRVQGGNVKAPSERKKKKGFLSPKGEKEETSSLKAGEKIDAATGCKRRGDA